MPEFNITKGTIILSFASLAFLLNCLIELNFFPESIFLIPIITVLSIGAVYAAATDMDYSVFDTSKFGKYNPRYLSDSSVVSTLSFIIVVIGGIDILIRFLVLDGHPLAFEISITLFLSIIGVILASIGGYIAHMEWEG